jgi:hypothetical protein
MYVSSIECIYVFHMMLTIYLLSISIKMDVCVYVCFSITLERLERFRPNLVHILLYVYVRILCIYYIVYSAGRMVWEAGNLDDSHC